MRLFTLFTVNEVRANKNKKSKDTENKCSNLTKYAENSCYIRIGNQKY